MSAEFIEIVFGCKYFGEKVFGGLMEMMEFLAGEVGFEEYSKKEVFFHELAFLIGLLGMIHCHY